MVGLLFVLFQTVVKRATGVTGRIDGYQHEDADTPPTPLPSESRFAVVIVRHFDLNSINFARIVPQIHQSCQQVEGARTRLEEEHRAVLDINVPRQEVELRNDQATQRCAVEAQDDVTSFCFLQEHYAAINSLANDKYINNSKCE